MSLKVELLKHHEIQTQRLTLRPVRLDDAEDFYRLGSDPDVSRFTMTFKSLDEAVDNLAEYWMGDPLGKFSVVLTATNQFVGAVELHTDERNKTGEIGYLIASAFWGNGYAPEASKALLALCFDSLDLTRVEARYDERNFKSGRVLAKLGFHEEGKLRNARMHHGESVTDVVAAITADEYRAAQAQ